MRGDAEFGVFVHFARTDLHFEVAPFRTDHGGMQRAVVVALGLGDIIVELGRDRRPELVHEAERCVTIGDVVHQHAHRAHVVQLAERHALALHLLPDAVDVLRPAGDLGLDAFVGQEFADAALDVLDETFAIAAFFVEQTGDALIGFRLQVAEGEIFQFPLQLPDAEAVGQGRMDVHRELGQGGLFLARRLAGRAHARQMFGQQDQHHAQVADDREQQAAQSLGAAAVLALRMQAPDLFGGAQAVQQQLQSRCGLRAFGRVQGAQFRRKMQQGRELHFGIGLQSLQQLDHRRRQRGQRDGFAFAQGRDPDRGQRGLLAIKPVGKNELVGFRTHGEGRGRDRPTLTGVGRGHNPVRSALKRVARVERRRRETRGTFSVFGFPFSVVARVERRRRETRGKFSVFGFQFSVVARVEERNPGAFRGSRYTALTPSPRPTGRG